MMGKQFSHCSYCGVEFPPAVTWPRTCLACSRTSYRNPLPVAVVILPMANGVVVIRRDIEPSKGKLALPGGYLDIGETWQQGAQRELQEETGIKIDTREIALYDVQNGLDDTLVIFGLVTPQPLSMLKPFRSFETSAVVLIEGPTELGFPMHTAVIEDYFSKNRM